MSSSAIVDEEDGTIACCVSLAALRKPVDIGQLEGFGGFTGESAFWIWPWFGPLLFENSSSDVRGPRPFDCPAYPSLC